MSRDRFGFNRLPDLKKCSSSCILESDLTQILFSTKKNFQELKNKNNDTVIKAQFITHKNVHNVVQVQVYDDDHIDVPVPFDRANVDVPNVMVHVTVVPAQLEVPVITAV